MGKKNMISFRGVDEEVFQQFKKAAVEEHESLGSALTAAMSAWIRERSKWAKEFDPKKIEKMCGFIKGRPGNYSETIDETLYRWEKERWDAK